MKCACSVLSGNGSGGVCLSDYDTQKTNRRAASGEGACISPQLTAGGGFMCPWGWEWDWSLSFEREDLLSHR